MILANFLCVLVLALSLVNSVVAFEGISQIGYGPKSQSMGGTGVADDTGVGGLLNNPSTLALGNKDKFEVGADLIVPFYYSRSLTGLGKAESKQRDFNRNPYLAPQGGYVKRLSNKLSIGIAAYSKGGAGFEYGNNSFLSIDSTGAQTGRDNGSRLLGLDIPIGFAYKFNDRLNIGGTFDVIWTGSNLLWQVNADQLASFASTGALRVSNNAGLATNVNNIVGLGGGLYFDAHKRHPIDGAMSGFGWSARLGMTYQLTPKTRLGLSYTFKTKLDDLSGKATADALLPGGASAVTLSGDVRMEDFQWPSMLQIGLHHQFNDQWSVLLDTRYAQWAEVMKDIKIRYKVTSDTAGNAFVGETIDLDIPQNWDDTLAVAIGIKYQLNDQWTLRAGVSVIDNPVSANNLLAVLPTVFEQHTTMGFGYKINNKQSIDFSYSYISMDSVTNRTRPLTSTHGAPTGGTEFDMHIHKLVFSYTHSY